MLVTDSGSGVPQLTFHLTQFTHQFRGAGGGQAGQL
jgi:hypothetical protein